MEQITYRLSRNQLLAVFAGFFVLVSGALGWLVGRDLTLQPTVRTVSSQRAPGAAAGAAPAAEPSGSAAQARASAAGGGAPAAATAGMGGGAVDSGRVLT